MFVGSWPTKVGSTSRSPAETWWVLLAIANLGQKTNNNCLQKSRFWTVMAQVVCTSSLAGGKEIGSGHIPMENQHSPSSPLNKELPVCWGLLCPQSGRVWTSICTSLMSCTPHPAPRTHHPCGLQAPSSSARRITGNCSGNSGKAKGI